VIEAEWLTSTDPTPMLKFLRGKVSDRKLRLFVAGCCYVDYRPSTVIPAYDVVQEFADGRTTLDDAPKHLLTLGSTNELAWPKRPFQWAAIFISRCPTSEDADEEDEGYPMATKIPPIMRDVFGNPFRPVSLDPGWPQWNGGTVTKIAQAIYDERQLPSGHLDTTRLAILADALEDAGCDQPDLLDHLRGPGPHVRGCWVVDLLLGKE
jgi:hypothetical protein